MFVLWPNKSDGVVWMREELERFRKIYGKTFLPRVVGDTKFSVCGNKMKNMSLW